MTVFVHMKKGVPGEELLFLLTDTSHMVSANAAEKHAQSFFDSKTGIYMIKLEDSDRWKAIIHRA
jgi:hypothetical protein